MRKRADCAGTTPTRALATTDGLPHVVCRHEIPGETGQEDRKAEREGIGGALVQEGLRICRQRDIEAVVVVGHPEYYPRFGFTSGSRFGIACEYDVPDDAFLAIELVPVSLRAAAGTVRYHPAFADA